MKKYFFLALLLAAPAFGEHVLYYDVGLSPHELTEINVTYLGVTKGVDECLVMSFYLLSIKSEVLVDVCPKWANYPYKSWWESHWVAIGAESAFRVMDHLGPTGNGWRIEAKIAPANF